MVGNAVRQLGRFGQSIWLDEVGRDLVPSGGLERLIVADGLRGLISGPCAFEAAVVGCPLYDVEIRALSAQGRTPKAVYEGVCQTDLQAAADELRPTFEATSGQDGYVSLATDPRLARQTDAVVQEARRLWASLERPNALINVVATAQGPMALQQLIAEGINVNVTLLFSLSRYRQVAEAYIAGLEERAASGLPLAPVASVVSFFVSRIDALVDARLEGQAAQGGEQAALAETVRGSIGIACAKLVHQAQLRAFSSVRFRRLAALGARPQRMLWVSSGTQDPPDGDVKYMEALIGPGTVHAVGLGALAAYRDQGQPQGRLEKGLAAARAALGRLPRLGIIIDDVTRLLEDEGVERACRAFDHSVQVVGERAQLLGAEIHCVI